MEPIIRDIHALRSAAVVEDRQHTPELSRELRIDAADVISREEALQSLVSKPFDHL
jgi:hypothetical protein